MTQRFINLHKSQGGHRKTPQLQKKIQFLHWD